MALFSKPPAKKPGPVSAKAPHVKPAAAGDARRVSARDLAAKGMSGAKPKLQPVAADEPITGASLIEWSPQPQAFEVAQANPGLCAVLENAALLFANGQAASARELLEQGVATDHDAKQSPLAWLALFDLLQRAGDRSAFDQATLRYSIQFERSAPMWEGRSDTPAAPKAGGYMQITGKLTAESAHQIEGIRKAIAKRATGVRLDLSKLATFDDAGARLLATALADARRATLMLTLEHPKLLAAALEAAVKSGREGGEGAWLLSMELLQWAHDQAKFDDRAIEYAIAYEMSPPSWEPPPLALEPADPQAADAAAAAASAADAEALKFSGVLAGSAGSTIAEVQQFAHGRHVVAIDMTAVDRIDFVCAGALLNAVNRIEAQRKAVQILGSTPIIRALLLLIGLSPRHFVKKTL